MKKFFLIISLFCAHNACGMEDSKSEESLRQHLTLQVTPILENLVVYPLGQFKHDWQPQYGIPDHVIKENCTPQEIVAAVGCNIFKEDKSLISKVISNNNRQQHPYLYHLACGYAKKENLAQDYNEQLESLKQQHHQATVKKRILAGLGIGCTAGLAYLLFQQSKSGSLMELLDIKNNCSRIASALTTIIPLCGFSYWKTNKYSNVLNTNISDTTRKAKCINRATHNILSENVNIEEYIQESIGKKEYSRLFQTIVFDFERSRSQLQDSAQCLTKIDHQMGFGGYIKKLMGNDSLTKPTSFIMQQPGYYPMPIAIERQPDRITFTGFPGNNKLEWQRFFTIQNITTQYVRAKSEDLLTSIETNFLPLFRTYELTDGHEDFEKCKNLLFKKLWLDNPCLFYLVGTDDTPPILVEIQHTNEIYTITRPSDNKYRIEYSWEGSKSNTDNIERIISCIRKNENEYTQEIFSYDDETKNWYCFKHYIEGVLDNAKTGYITRFKVQNGNLSIPFTIEKRNNEFVFIGTHGNRCYKDTVPEKVNIDDITIMVKNTCKTICDEQITDISL